MADGAAAPRERNIGVGQSVDGSALVSGDNNQINQSHTVNHYYGLPETQPAPTRKDRNEKTLIDAVWTEVDDRLRQSLHNAILIRLDMAEQRSQVSRPWDSELRTAEQKAKTLTPNTPIAEVFDRRDVGGKLLVLGNPGAGKTTTMLDLAAALVQRANADPDEPIPVMVNLSSWQNPKQSFADWLLNELKLKYGVSQKLGQTWLSEKKLLPLVDGLDELPPTRQEPAVQGINTWLQSDTGAPRLLVCSRREEYELYAAKLNLNSTISLSPLTDEQLHSYLYSLDMMHLWETLQHDNDLLKLVRTPLLLSVSILANDAFDLTHWQRLSTTQERLDYLLHIYIVQQIHKSTEKNVYLPGKEPSGQQTRHWLMWLAQQLQVQSEDEFLIERMQPTTLKRKYQYLYIALFLLLRGFFLISIFIAISLFLIALRIAISVFRYGEIKILDLNFSWIISYLAIGSLLFWIAGVILSMIIHFDSIKNIKTVDKLSFSIGDIKVDSWRKFNQYPTYRSILKGVVLGLAVSVLMQMFGNEDGKSALSDAVIISLPSRDFSGIYLNGIVSGGLLGFLLGFSNALVDCLKIDTEYRALPNDGIFQSIRNVPLLIFLKTFFSTACVFVMLLASTNEFLSSLSTAIIIGLIFAPFLLVFSEGGLPAFQHISLRIVLCFLGVAPWDYALFLDHCTERRLLQRVGGRYRFIHRLVQEHFAAMPLDR